MRPVSVRDTERKWGTYFSRTIAAPSFVLPAGAKDNALFLADLFPEIALLFFEADACLAYTEEELPKELAELPCSWHVHLPLDFDWSGGLDPVWYKLDGLIDKAAYLAPKGFVLHPPEAPDMLLPLAARLKDKGVDPALFLIENIRGHSLTPIWDEVVEGGYSVCIDIGHLLAYDQLDMLDLPGLWPRVRMFHVYGEEKRMKHWPLSHLDEQGEQLLEELLTKAPDATVTLEIFEEAGLFESLDILGRWMAEWEAAK